MKHYGYTRQRGSQKRPHRVTLAIESLEPRRVLSAQPLISEFMASNSSTLLDGAGNASDWIELYNAGDEAVDLGSDGWYLTDNAGDLTTWQFPATTQSILDPGEYLVIFASGTGVPDVAGNIHTNFKLSSAAEYVGLVMPDGATVVSEVGPGGTDYPQQYTDVSYGFVGSPLADASPIQYHDADEAPGGNTSGLWGGWIPRGAGAGDGTSNFANEGGALQASGSVSELATTIAGLDSSQVYEVYAFFWDDTPGASWNIQAGLTSGQLADFDNSAADVFRIDATTQVAGSAQLVSGLNVLGQSGDTYDDWIDGNRDQYAAYLGQVGGSTTATIFINHDSSLSQRTWYDGVGLRPTGLLVDAVSAAHFLIPTNDNLGSSWTTNTFNAVANGFTAGKPAIGYENNPNNNENSFADEILNPELPSGTTSVYLRTEFYVDDASSITGLMLDAKYDDGFVAYLNGTSVISQFAPANPTYNSTATSTTRSDADSLQYETFSLTGFSNLLVDGQNTLAIHALNRPNSTDFLFSPRLTALTGTISFSDIRYLTTPTPGSLNGLGVLGFVGDTHFSNDRGFYDAPINVDITTNTLGADIYYTLDGSLPEPTNPSAILASGPVLVDQTTTLRAAAFKDGFEPSDVDTQTYVFLDDTFTQDPINNPKQGLSYPATWQGGFAGDYTIDSRVVTQWDDSNPADPADFGIREGLKSLPTISLVMDHDDLWNASSGIYPNATSQGSAWRRPGSVEYFDPNTGEQFQYNVGIQMQGAASRDNNRLLKHSFRLVFNSQFDGPGRLDFPLFDNSDFADIDTVSLKASFTDAFATRTSTNRYSPLDSAYMRDVWMRDSQIATGNLAADSTYVHLYINGLYWGLYWPSERVDDAYLSSRLGGAEEDWDILRDFNSLFRGSRTAYDQMFALSRQIDSASASTANDLFQQIQGKNPDGTDDPNTDALLDVDNFVDYIVLHLYAGVEDWPSHNWYAARNRVDPGKGFQFFTWDQEIGLDQLYRDRTEASNSSTPGELLQNLQNSSEFRLRFADRVQKHLFNDGALTTAASQARWMQRANQIEAGIIGESARWGDAREGQSITAYTSLGPFSDGHIPTGGQTVPLMTVDHWRETVAYVHDSFLVNAGDLLIQRLLNDGLYTSLPSPEFLINDVAQHGGLISAGSSLSLNTSGTTYFTLDGSDPRDVAGNPVGTEYTGPISLNTATVVNARTFSGGTWSALSEASFTANDGAIVISEINYNPYAPTTPAELAIVDVDNDDFEFVELLNTHPTDTVNLNAFQLASGISYTFGNVTLAPGQRAVVVEDQQAFEARYGTEIPVIGKWSGGLSNAGETIRLLNGLGTEIVSVSYDDRDPWAISADGVGATLVLDDPGGTPTDQAGKHYRWRGSAELGGTPGASSSPLVGVVINEVLSHTDAPQEVDSIELFNPTASAIEMGGWYLSDSGNQLLKYEIPAGMSLGAGEYVVFDETDFNPTPQTPGTNDFALNGSQGDEVYLVIPDGSGGISAFVDQVDFGAAFNGQTFGRLPNGSGRLAPLLTNTLGEANSRAAVGPLVISEVNYHPADPSPAALAIDPTITDNDLEFIEVYNPTSSPVVLTDWRLRGESDYDFGAGTSLAAGASLVVVSFDPNDVANASRRDAFRSHYGIGSEVALVGAFDASLSNGMGRVELQQPDDPPVNNPTFVPHITADEVLYDDLSPWPNLADGGGESLERVGPTLYGNAVASWLGALPSPGTVDFTPALEGDYDRNQTVDSLDYDVWKSSFGSTIALNADGNGNGLVDVGDFTVWRDNRGASLAAQTAVAVSVSQELESSGRSSQVEEVLPLVSEWPAVFESPASPRVPAARWLAQPTFFVMPGQASLTLRDVADRMRIVAEAASTRSLQLRDQVFRQEIRMGTDYREIAASHADLETVKESTADRQASVLHDLALGDIDGSLAQWLRVHRFMKPA